MIGYIYKITIYDVGSSLNNKVYIGKRQKDEVDKRYFGSGKILKDYIKSKGTKNLKREILCKCDSIEELNFWEKFYIDISSNLLNIAPGGTGGDTFSNLPEKQKEERRRKLKRKLTDEQKTKLSEIFKGREVTWGNKISESQKIKYKERTKEFYNKRAKKTQATKIKNGNVSSWNKGIPMSEKAKRKRNENVEWRKNLSIANKGKHWFTNGVENSYSFECPEGFYKGMTRK